MYIIERIISIAIFMAITLLTTYRLSSAKNIKQTKGILIIYVVCLAVLSFFYVPAETADLTRLKEYINNTYQRMTFNEYLKMLLITPTYTTHTFYFVVAKIGVLELLSVIACIINYSIISYILLDYTKRKRITNFGIANAFFLYMVTGQFMEVISGLRSMCAFSLVFLCIYREFFQNKRIVSNILIYALAIGFHSAAVPLVIMRIGFLIIQKEDKIIKKIINKILFVAFFIILIICGRGVLEETIFKANIYLTKDIFSYFWTQLSSGLVNTLFIYVYFSNKKIFKEKIHKNYIMFFIVMLIIDSVFGFIEYSIFRRYNRFLVMLILPLIMEKFNYDNRNIMSIRKQETLYYVMLFLIMMIEISRGDLCGVRYFTFS